MKFNRLKLPADFQAMLKHDDHRFKKAFSGKNADSGANAKHRKWVYEVFECFAENMSVKFNQAVQALKTGNMEALQRVHMNIVDKARREGIDVHPVHVTYATMSPKNFQQACLHNWGRALDLRHPDDVVIPIHRNHTDIPVTPFKPFYTAAELDIMEKGRLPATV